MFFAKLWYTHVANSHRNLNSRVEEIDDSMTKEIKLPDVRVKIAINNFSLI